MLFSAKNKTIFGRKNLLWLGRVSQELNYEDDDYINGMEENLLLYDNGSDYFMQEDEIPPEFRPDSRSGFYDSHGPGYYQQTPYENQQHYYQ